MQNPNTGTEKVFQEQASRSQFKKGVRAEGRRHSKQREENVQTHRGIDECLCVEDLRASLGMVRMQGGPGGAVGEEMKRQAEEAEARSFMLSSSRFVWNVYYVPSSALC